MLLLLQLLALCLGVVRLAVALDNSFFTRLELRDAITGHHYTSDPTRWFKIDAELFICAGQDKEIYLSIPDDFTSIAQTPFNLLHKSRTVGKAVAQDNVIRISFPSPPSQNITATFSLVTRLSDEALQSLTEPQAVEYVFHSSQGETFRQSLRYVGKNMNELTVDSGHYEHNSTTWYTVDVPVSQLNEPVIIISKPRTDAYCKIVLDKTRSDLVTSVNAFNEPTQWVPLAPLEDLSTETAIDWTFDKNVDGFYVRITYFVEIVERRIKGGQINFHKKASEGTNLNRKVGGGSESLSHGH